MKNVFISGGAGFIGSKVANLFTKNNYEVTVFDSFEYYFAPEIDGNYPSKTSRLVNSENLKIVRGNILNKYHLEHEIIKSNPEHIIHAASLPLANIAIDMTEEAYESILTSTLNILEIIRRNKLKSKLVFLSSSMVYGDFKEIPVTEDHPTEPKEIYGTLKLMAEKLIIAYGKRHNVPYSIIRPSAVYGIGDQNARVIHKFARAAISGDILHVDGDGSNKADFTNIIDIATAIFKCTISDKTNFKTYNATTGNAISLNDVIDIIRSEYPELKVQYGKKPDFVPMRGSLDITSLKTDSGYTPSMSTRDGVIEYIEHLKNNDY